MKTINFNGKIYEATVEYDSRKKALVYTTAAGKLVKGQDDFSETYVPRFSGIEVIALPEKPVKTRKQATSTKTTAREYFGWLCREVLVKRINEKAKEEGNAMIESISARSLRGNELSEKQEWCLAFYAEKHQLSYFDCI